MMSKTTRREFLAGAAATGATTLPLAAIAQDRPVKIGC